MSKGPQMVKTEEKAVALAKGMTEQNDGVIAYSVEYDPDSDFYGDAKVLFKHGALPQELDEL